MHLLLEETGAKSGLHVDVQLKICKAGEDVVPLNRNAEIEDRSPFQAGPEVYDAWQRWDLSCSGHRSLVTHRQKTC